MPSQLESVIGFILYSAEKLQVDYQENLGFKKIGTSRGLAVKLPMSSSSLSWNQT